MFEIVLQFSYFKTDDIACSQDKSSITADRKVNLKVPKDETETLCRLTQLSIILDIKPVHNYIF